MALFYSRRSSSRRRSRSHHDEPYSMSHRPTFGQWLKHAWKDIATMVILGALGLGIYMLPPAPSRSFPVTFSDGEIVYPEFAYPLRKEIIPIWLAALLAALIPIFVMLSLNIARIRSFWDANNSIMGLLYSLITAAVFQVFIKWLIGGLRPHFLDVCKPDISLATEGANGVGGFKQIYYTKDICTGDKSEVNDSLESFPSGHATAAFAGFIYLSLYINAKLKVFADTHTSMWKLSAVWAPVLGAVLIAGALTIDEFHNWYDVFAGAVIGTCMAISSYRMVYAAVWDWRWNHVPLHRGVSLAWTGREEEEWGYAVATRKGRWQGYGRHGVWSEKRRHTSSGGRSPYRGSNIGVTHPGRAVGSRSPRRGDNMV